MPLSLSFDPFCLISLPSGNPYLSCKSSVKSCLESGEVLARKNVFFHLDKETGLI